MSLVPAPQEDAARANRDIIRQGGKDVRVWALAPERENIEEFVLACKEENPNVIFSPGENVPLLRVTDT